MAPRDAERTLQLTWHANAPHLWAIDRADTSASPPLELVRLIDRQLGGHTSMLGAPGRIGLELPAPLGPRLVPTLRLTPATVASALLANAVDSASVSWFRALADLAQRTVRAGRLRPVLHITGAVHQARWRSVPDDAQAEHLAALAAAMPAVCAVGDIDEVFDAFVDAIARRRLSRVAWRPPQPRNGRGAEYRAAQATLRALASESGNVLYRNDDAEALAELQRAFEHERERARGVPVIAAQVRLRFPEEIDEPWTVRLELVDVDAPDHWCTAADVVGETPLAVDLAGRAGHLPVLRSRIATAGADVAGALSSALEPFAEWVTEPSADIELELADVETFLAAAPELLHRIDVRLIGPEQLVKARPGMRAAASPRPPSAATGRFAAGALVEWNATVDDTPIDDAQLERAAAAGSSLLHVNGRWVRLDTADVRSTLERLHRNRTEHADMDVAELLRLAAEAELDAAPNGAGAAQKAGGLGLAVDGTGWLAELLAGLPDERLVEVEEPPAFVGELRHYQRRGLSWMAFLARVGLGGCLADDMGLGKTATTLAHLATRPGPHLVVCPLSVVHNWHAEAARFTPQLQVAIHHGTLRSRDVVAAHELVPTDLVITTYGTLARDVEALAAVPWDTLVLDEAQAVKNHLTRAARAVRQIPAGQRLALTGTPVENHLGELWAILDAVNPGLLGSAAKFSDRFTKPIQRDGDQAATAALRTLTQPFILRRTKADKSLLPELPDKIEQIAWATLTREQATMYQGVVDQLLADASAETGMKRRGLVLAALTRLKQICNHPAHAAADGSRLAGRSGKLARFDELVDDLLDVGERALVFTQFREMGLLLQRHLGERLGMEAPFLHGGVTRTGRDAMVQRFQSGEGPPILLVSLKAGGTGLNLTNASQVIHYDRWWNPAVEDQATDRAWRLGQTHTVLVHKLVCEGTLEEKISQLIDDKRALAASVLGTGEQWLSELSTDALRDLVTLRPTEST